MAIAGEYTGLLTIASLEIIKAIIRDTLHCRMSSKLEKCIIQWQGKPELNEMKNLMSIAIHNSFSYPDLRFRFIGALLWNRIL